MSADPSKRVVFIAASRSTSSDGKSLINLVPPKNGKPFKVPEDELSRNNIHLGDFCLAKIGPNDNISHFKKIIDKDGITFEVDQDIAYTTIEGELVEFQCLQIFKTGPFAKILNIDEKTEQLGRYRVKVYEISGSGMKGYNWGGIPLQYLGPSIYQRAYSESSEGVSAFPDIVKKPEKDGKMTAVVLKVWPMGDRFKQLLWVFDIQISVIFLSRLNSYKPGDHICGFFAKQNGGIWKCTEYYCLINDIITWRIVNDYIQIDVDVDRVISDNHKWPITYHHYFGDIVDNNRLLPINFVSVKIGIQMKKINEKYNWVVSKVY